MMDTIEEKLKVLERMKEIIDDMILDYRRERVIDIREEIGIGD